MSNPHHSVSFPPSVPETLETTGNQICSVVKLGMKIQYSGSEVLDSTVLFVAILFIW